MTRSSLFVGVLLLALPLLSGCAEWQQHMHSRLPEPLPAYADKQITVATTRSAYAVAYATGSTRPSPDQVAQLSAFLDSTTQGYKSQVLVEQLPRKASRVHRQRVEGLISQLQRQGYTVGRYDAGLPQDGEVRLAVDHYIAIPPNCPSWQVHKYEAFGSQPSPNLGCADRSNLAAMVANPSDLVIGDVPSPPAGQAVLWGEIRHRSDSIRPLQDAGSGGSN